MKPWEQRATDDRTFEVGDTVTFREWDPNDPGKKYTGRAAGPVRILYVLQQQGVCIFTHT